LSKIINKNKDGVKGTNKKRKKSRKMTIIKRKIIMKKMMKTMIKMIKMIKMKRS